MTTVFGVIYPPLVGLGKVVEKPWAEGGLLGVRPVLTATLFGRLVRGREAECRAHYARWGVTAA